MAYSQPRGSLGSSRDPVLGGQGVHGHSDNRQAIGNPLGTDFVIDVNNVDEVYRYAVRMQRERPRQMVPFLEQIERTAVRNRMLAQQTTPMGTPLSIFPSQDSYLVQKMRRITNHLMLGLIAGVRGKLSGNPQAFVQFNKRLGQSLIVTAVVPPVFWAGACVGVLDDMAQAIVGLYQIVTNFYEIMTSTLELITGILEDDQAAFEFGKVMGGDLGTQIISLSAHGPIRFTFEIARIIGPTIIYTLLAFTGIGAYCIGARLFKDLLKVLSKFPKIKRLLNALERLAMTGRRYPSVLVAISHGAEKAGMTLKHGKIFKEVAKLHNRIIIVRFTNPLSVKWIKRGFPAKPLGLDVHTSPKTGIVTVTKATKPEHIRKALDNGHYIVDADGVPRNRAGQSIDLPEKPDWPLEKGQVIDPTSKRPFVGDYDLHSVIDPDATGRNLVLKSSDGADAPDLTNPDIQRTIRALNGRMDQRRVMHGASDGYTTLEAAGDGAIAFHPDGKVQIFERTLHMEQYFKDIGRVTIKGEYPVPARPDILPEGALPFPSPR